MAVTAIGGGVAEADPTSVVSYAPIVKPDEKPKPVEAIKPLFLKTGAPACGNVVFKSARPMVAEDPFCPVIRNMREIEEMARNIKAQLKKPAGTAEPLTLAPVSRPGL